MPTPISQPAPQLPPETMSQSSATTLMPQKSPNSVSSTSQAEDEILLKAYIGNNYEKITTRPFNFAGFFLGTFYLFYRKMFLYGLLLFLINFILMSLINNIFVSLIFCIIIGLLINKLYLKFAKKNIAKIKLQNTQANQNSLIELCTTKGRTSFGNVFLGLLGEIVIAFVVAQLMLLMGFNNMFQNIFQFNNNENVTDNNTQEENQNKDSNTSDSPSSNETSNDKLEKKLLEDVKISGYSCFTSNCTIMILDETGTVNYSYKANNIDLFKSLNDYQDDVKVNIYYTQSEDKKTIVDYQLFLKSTNEDITNIKTQNELRKKLGLYSEGKHTEKMTLIEIGMTGSGFKNDAAYSYTDYTFKDSHNKEFEMEYINPQNPNDLIEGNQYTVTFEVVEGTFDYEYNIISIK